MSAPSRRRSAHPVRSKSLIAKAVGYGHPPIEHQFRPGQSGNPKGRPKGSTSEASLLEAVLARRIPVFEHGAERRITVLEAIFLRMADDALKGNGRAAAFLLNRLKSIEAEKPAGAVDVALDADDHAILAAYARKVLAQTQGPEEQS